MNGEINGAMAMVLVMLILLSIIAWNDIRFARWLAAKLEARGFYLENTRAEADRFRAMADERCAARMREYDEVRPLDQVDEQYPPAAPAPRPPEKSRAEIAAMFNRVEPRGLAGE